MMSKNAQLELQAYLDGELRGRAARRVERWLASDPEACALAAKLEALKRALATDELILPVPEAREFYWSKIAAQITRPEAARPEPAIPKAVFWFKRLVAPALAVASVLILVGMAVVHFGSRTGVAVGEHEVIAALADPGAFTYRDHAAGITLVWFSYPAQN